MIHPLIISRLIEARRRFWTSLDHGNLLLIQEIGNDQMNLFLCITLIATSDKTGNPVAKVNRTLFAVACVDVTTRTVWLFPTGFCEDQGSLRLGKSREEFVLPEPKSLSFSEQKDKRKERHEGLKAQAKRMMEEKEREA